jgi:hypothetical protein
VKEMVSKFLSADLQGMADLILFPDFTCDSLEVQEWLSVIELLGARIVDAADSLADHELGRSSQVYVKLIELAMDVRVIDQQEVACRILNLSSVLLSDMTTDARVALLSPRFASEIFAKSVPLSLDETARLTGIWRELDVDDIRRLRGVKNLLSPMLRIKESVGNWELPDCLNEWEVLYPKLP